MGIEGCGGRRVEQNAEGGMRENRSDSSLFPFNYITQPPNHPLGYQSINRLNPASEFL